MNKFYLNNIHKHTFLSFYLAFTSDLVYYIENRLQGSDTNALNISRPN